MYKTLYLHIWTLLMYLTYFSQRELTREDHSFDPYLLPEFHLCPISVICLYREMNLGLRIGFSYERYESWIRHDISIRLHCLHLI